MRYLWFMIGFVFLGFWPNPDTFSQSNQEMKEVNVIPAPQKLHALKNTAFQLLSPVKIIVESSSINKKATAVAELFAALKKFRGLTIITERANEISPNSIFLAKSQSPASQMWLEEHGLTFAPEMEREGYILNISEDGVVVIGHSDQGLFYGVMTLIQVIENAETANLPGMQIQDWPAMQFRGISDDISRGQVSTMRHFKKILRFMARYKMNTYMPYLEDMFRFKKYPQIGKGRGALTAAEVKELQAYAKKYFVEVIPIFQTLGHYENILNQPEFMHLADFPGAASLSPAKPAVYHFLEDLMDEIAPAFASPYFHIGADESWDVGKGASRALVERYDIATVHAHHYQKVADILRKHHKKVLMYGDIILQQPTILNQLPKDIIVVDWHYGAALHYPSVEIFEQASQPFIVSPGMSDWKRIFPDYVNAFINIQNLTQQGYQHGALGSIVSTWGDYGGANFRELNWLGYAFAADCAWNPEKVDVERFRNTFLQQFYGWQPDLAATIYTLLSRMGGGLTYNEVWSHPFAPYRKTQSERLPRSLEIRLLAGDALRLIHQLENQAQKNTDHIAYLKFAARLGQWIGEKQAFVNQWANLMQENPTPEERMRFKEFGVNQSLELAKQLETLKQEYQLLWLKYARPENLQLLLDLFDLQIQYFRIKADQILDDNFDEDPSLPGQFIYFPTAADDEATVPESYFRRSLALDKKPKKALLQVINDGAVTAYVNGQKVGEAVARRALSLRVYQSMVKVFDVTANLEKGKNLLAFSAKNFGDRAKAGVNLYLYLEFTDGSASTLVSDKYWKTADRAFSHWQQPDFDDSGWYHAITRPKSIFISRPYFERNIASRVDTE